MDKLPKFVSRCTPTEKRKRGSQKPPGVEQRWKSWRRWDLLGAKRRPNGKAQAKAKDRVEWRRLISTLRPTRDGEVVWVSSGWSRGGVGGPPPLIFRPIWGPKGRNFFFETGSPPLSQGQDQRPLSLSEGLDLPLVNESVSHSPMVRSFLNQTYLHLPNRFQADGCLDYILGIW